MPQVDVNYLAVVVAAVLTAASLLYENRPFGLWVLNAGYQLVSLALMGALLAVWA